MPLRPCTVTFDEYTLCLSIPVISSGTENSDGRVRVRLCSVSQQIEQQFDVGVEAGLWKVA